VCSEGLLRLNPGAAGMPAKANTLVQRPIQIVTRGLRSAVSRHMTGVVGAGGGGEKDIKQ